MVTRREARAVGRLVGKAANAVGAKVDEAAAQQLAEAREGDSPVVRAHLEAAAKLRRQADKFRADAQEAEEAGKASKAERLRKGAARPDRQADEWEAKAAAEAAKLRAWAAEQDAAE